MPTVVPGGLIWVCVDCYLTHHGYDEHELGYKPDSEPWALWTEVADITSGGACDCPEGEDEDLECDHVTFSWIACDGCGSTLGGAREAMTYWIQSED